MNGLFGDEQLVRMVPTIPAKAMGWDTFVGSMEMGKQADLLVIGSGAGDPYTTLIGATESDVAAVVIGGKLRAGRASWWIRRLPVWSSFTSRDNPWFWI